MLFASELQLAIGSFRARASATQTRKAGLALTNRLLEICLPFLLSCYPPKTWICPSAPLGLLPFPSSEVLRGSCSILMKTGHTVWKRSVKCPKLHSSQISTSVSSLTVSTSRKAKEIEELMGPWETQSSPTLPARD